MDDPSSTPQKPVAMTDEPVSLDAMTAELKSELALQELRAAKADADAVRRAKAALDALDECLEEFHPRNAKRKLTCVVERAMLALDALDAAEALASSDFIVRQTRYWSGVLAYCLTALIKLNSLLARSQRAFLRVPLFEDGPELSGFKHRLR
ncbi:MULTISPECIES: hypothetical protein [unclassified Pseudomonas]|uniref:hypothetical protein n=1 Tax=unclassified Pseudomonas TaxID=196821 RepID=UPI0021BBA4B9|nr:MULTISPECIES: hypothetical protein [unclassified Pseudomonas]MCT8162427.1 hypothetical protein [Pseudomonas sp. HD6422]MCT8183747.1 hypothetical protein [Pseudomonas sp. HD6421]